MASQKAVSHLVKTGRNGQLVEAWMERRLSFDPKGPDLELRTELRNAIRAMPSGKTLEATYVSESPEFFDVENILFYNVGTGAFRGPGGTHVRFERVRAVPPRAAEVPNNWQHYQRYELVDNTAPRWLERDATIVTVRFPLVDLSSELKPHTVWWSAARGEYTVARGPLGDGEEFRLAIRIVGPDHGSHPAGVMKSLFDGVICALHRSDPGLDASAVSRLAARLGAPGEAVEEMLLAPPAPVLGVRKILAAYREFVKWNPADDLCVAAEIVLETAAVPRWQIEASVAAIPEPNEVGGRPV